MKITEERIKELKDKHGDIKLIKIGSVVAIFRKPDIKTWRFALAALDTSSVDFKKTMAVNCFVDGDRDILSDEYIYDIIGVVDEFIKYEDAVSVRKKDHYIVSILGKECKLKPLTVELQSLAEKNNPMDEDFKTQQNLLEFMWIDGDKDIKDENQLDYHMPVLRILKSLRKKHLVEVKKL